MKWRARAATSRAKHRANISFFIFIIFFVVFGVIVLTELVLLERPAASGSARRSGEELQVIVNNKISINNAFFVGNRLRLLE